MLVKLDHVPKFWGENKKCLKPPRKDQWFLVGVLLFNSKPGHVGPHESWNQPPRPHGSWTKTNPFMWSKILILGSIKRYQRRSKVPRKKSGNTNLFLLNVNLQPDNHDLSVGIWLLRLEPHPIITLATSETPFVNSFISTFLWVEVWMESDNEAC